MPERLAITYRGRTVVVEKRDLPPTARDLHAEAARRRLFDDIASLPREPLLRRLGFERGKFPSLGSVRRDS